MITALVLFEDRITTWRQMKVLDQEIEVNPDKDRIKELAELRIRNLLCFKELQSLNDTGKFIYKHPFLVHRVELFDLQTLWNTNRSEFVRQYDNCKANIRRYRGRLNDKTINDNDREKNITLLMKHQSKEKIFKNILNNEPSNNYI